MKKLKMLTGIIMIIGGLAGSHFMQLFPISFLIAVVGVWIVVFAWDHEH